MCVCVCVCMCVCACVCVCVCVCVCALFQPNQTVDRIHIHMFTTVTVILDDLNIDQITGKEKKQDGLQR